MLKYTLAIGYLATGEFFENIHATIEAFWLIF